MHLMKLIWRLSAVLVKNGRSSHGCRTDAPMFCSALRSSPVASRWIFCFSLSQRAPFLPKAPGMQLLVAI